MDWSEHGGVLFVYGASAIVASVLLVLNALKLLAQYVENALFKAYGTINRMGRTKRNLCFVQGVQFEHLLYWSGRSRRKFWLLAFFLPLPIVLFRIVPISVIFILGASWVIFSSIAMVNPSVRFTVDPFTWGFAGGVAGIGSVAVTLGVIQTLYNAVKPFDLAVRDFQRLQRLHFEGRTYGGDIAPDA